MLEKVRIEERTQPFNQPVSVVYIFEQWNETIDINGDTVTVKTGEQEIPKEQFEAEVAKIESRKALIAEAQ